MKTIIEAIDDPNLFKPFLQDEWGSTETWRSWKCALRVLHGMEIRTPHDRWLVRECTGRSWKTLPSAGFRQALFLTGRRSGKSRISAIAAAYEGILSGAHKKLSKGEVGLVAVLAPTKTQASIVKNYLRGIFDSSEMLRSQVVAEQRDGFRLKTGIEIKILAGDWKSVRGFSLLACVVDEIAFMGLEDEHVRSDLELVRALLPSLATTGGRMICISTPYAARGYCYATFRKHFRNPDGTTLVWRSESAQMNPTLPQAVIDAALADDPAAARSEYLAEFRDDICAYIDRALLERLVIPNRYSLMPRPNTRYTAFCDVSGGRHDSATVCVAHLEGRVVVLDALHEYRPPFSPYDICRQIAVVARGFGISKIVGDNYGAEFTHRAFQACGLRYERCEKNKSELYRELLPRLTSGEIELLDMPRAISQIANLERRTRSGGKDIIDHPPKGHDDLANSVAGAAVTAAAHRTRAGSFDFEGSRQTSLASLTMSGYF